MSYNNSYCNHSCDAGSYRQSFKDPNKDINVNIHLIGSGICHQGSCPSPTVCPCPSQVTLTTGPFHIPIFADLQPVGIPNDRLIITLKNPTNAALSASLNVTACQLPVPAPTPSTPILFNFSTPEASISGFPVNVTVPANSCSRVEIPITAFQRGTLRITTTGPYAICDSEQVCGGLEISVAGGLGAATGGIADPGLNYADPSLTFRYEEFILCNTL